MTAEEQVQALRDPECEAESWWALALAYPAEAKASPLFPLLTLETPERWQSLMEVDLGDWLDTEILVLSWKNQHLFAADCEEHGRFWYGDKDPKLVAATEQRRRLANGEIDSRQWWKIVEAAKVAGTGEPASAVRAASLTRANGAWRARGIEQEWVKTRRCEQRWQIARLLHYLSLEER